MHGSSPCIKCFVPTCEISATLLVSSIDSLEWDVGVKPPLEMLEIPFWVSKWKKGICGGKLKPASKASECLYRTTSDESMNNKSYSD